MNASTALNADPMQPVVIDTLAMPWQASPSPGVERKRLERFGPEESGRVTSIVRYAAGSRFATHEHPEGEEILVLSGVFSDHTGDYGPGAYLLNPEGFAHAPFSRPGCRLFVKLRQYPGLNRQQIHLQTDDMAWEASSVEGLSVKRLYAQAGFPEIIRLERWAPRTFLPAREALTVEEIFVLDGCLQDTQGQYPAGTWRRLPPGPRPRCWSDTGCELYVRTGVLVSAWQQ